MSLESTLQELIEVMKEDIAVRRDFLNAFRTGTQPAERAAAPTTDAAPVEAPPAPVAEPAKATSETAPAEHADEPMSPGDYLKAATEKGSIVRDLLGAQAGLAKLKKLCADYGVKSSASVPPEKRRQFLADIDQMIAEARHV